MIKYIFRPFLLVTITSQNLMNVSRPFIHFFIWMLAFGPFFFSPVWHWQVKGRPSKVSFRVGCLLFLHLLLCLRVSYWFSSLDSSKCGFRSNRFQVYLHAWCWVCGERPGQGSVVSGSPAFLKCCHSLGVFGFMLHYLSAGHVKCFTPRHWWL